MPRPVTVTLTHDLGRTEARARVEKGFGRLKKAIAGGFLFKFTQNWAEDSDNDTLRFTAKGMGQNISGEILVYETYVHINVTLPNMLAAVAEAVTGRVRKEGQLMLGKD